VTFEAADRAVRDMNKRNLRAFDGLKTLKFDELNVMRMVTKVYDAAVRIAKRRYRQIAYDAYIAALILADVAAEKAKDMADDAITEDWVLDMLEDYDSVTHYRFDTEVERKKQRLAEAILSKNDKIAEVDKALRLFSQQLAQYADNSVIRATLDGYRDAGVEKVRWETEDDERVCRECEKRNGKVYAINKVPPAPHWRCRCQIWPMLD